MELWVSIFQENAAAAVREFRRLKKQRCGPVLESAFSDVMVKFEKTVQLDVLPGRGPKGVNTTVVENIATAVEEASSKSFPGTVSVSTISHTLDMPYSTDRHIIRKILNFYTYKIQAVQLLKPHDPGIRKTLVLEFLARIAVDDAGPLRMDGAHFHLKRQDLPPVNGKQYGEILTTYVLPTTQQRGCLQGPWVAWLLEHRTHDRKDRARCPVLQNTLRVHTEYVLVKSVGPKVLWAESQGDSRIFPPSSSMAKMWRWRSVVSSSIVPSRNFSELIRTAICMVLKA
ncbi:DUF4817 domain-containing protein [Trichonephila clavipes]|nr:DUF4817 domain-containing protein [Trichonephila clavipes]